MFIREFLAVPVFRLEDTDGEALEYQKIELPEFPLKEVAQNWGISVKAIPGNYLCYGYYLNSSKEIALATKEEAVFFHELAHAGHARLGPGIGARFIPSPWGNTRTFSIALQKRKKGAGT